jgi:hypothetical protein
MRAEALGSTAHADNDVAMRCKKPCRFRHLCGMETYRMTIAEQRLLIPRIPVRVRGK